MQEISDDADVVSLQRTAGRQAENLLGGL